MKESVNVSLVQLDCAWLEPERNAERMAEFVEREAADHGAELVVFPEMASTGYMPASPDRDFIRRLFDASEPIPGPTTERLGGAAARRHVHVIAGISQTHPSIPHSLYNSAVLIDPSGELAGVYHKAHPALEEKHVYARGSTVDVYETELGRIAINICYDVRFPELARAQALKGAEILVSVWSMYEQPGKAPSDSIVVRCRSRATENFMYVLGCNRSGSEGGRVYFGRSVISAPSGDVLAQSDGDAEEVLRATLTDVALREQRMYLPVFHDRRPELYGPIVEPL